MKKNPSRLNMRAVQPKIDSFNESCMIDYSWRCLSRTSEGTPGLPWDIGVTATIEIEEVVSGKLCGFGVFGCPSEWV